MLFFFSQNLIVPQNSLASVAHLVGEDGSFSRELAVWERRIGCSDWALSEVCHGAVAAHISEEFLDTHFDGGWRIC
jgi:hypothetical protein